MLSSRLRSKIIDSILPLNDILKASAHVAIRFKSAKKKFLWMISLGLNLSCADKLICKLWEMFGKSSSFNVIDQLDFRFDRKK